MNSIFESIKDYFEVDIKIRSINYCDGNITIVGKPTQKMSDNLRKGHGGAELFLSACLRYHPCVPKGTPGISWATETYTFIKQDDGSFKFEVNQPYLD